MSYFRLCLLAGSNTAYQPADHLAGARGRVRFAPDAYELFVVTNRDVIEFLRRLRSCVFDGRFAVGFGVYDPLRHETQELQDMQRIFNTEQSCETCAAQ